MQDINRINCSEEMKKVGTNNVSGKNHQNIYKIPISSNCSGSQYIIGVLSFEQVVENLSDNTQSNQEQERKIHLYPPKILLMSFPKPLNKVPNQENKDFKLEMNENDEEDCDNYKNQIVFYNGDQLPLQENKRIKHSNNDQSLLSSFSSSDYLQSTFYDYENIDSCKGMLLERDQQNKVLKFWMRKFIDWCSRIPPCCKRTKQFWEWVFKMNPDSGFIWKTQSYDMEWLKFNLKFSEFRNALRNWINLYSNKIIQEYEQQKLKQKLLRYSLNIIQYELNIQSLNQTSQKLLNQNYQNALFENTDLNIANQGILIQPDLYLEPISNCKAPNQKKLIEDLNKQVQQTELFQGIILKKKLKPIKVNESIFVQKIQQ